MSLSDAVDGIIHEPTQLRDGAVDLTVTECYELTSPGRLDFGGGEFEAAECRPHEKHYRTPEDDYQWWDLDPGRYLLEYNEKLSVDDRVSLQPRTELLELGCLHPTVQVSTLPRMPLQVGGSGLLLKENARVSTLLVGAAREY